MTFEVGKSYGYAGSPRTLVFKVAEKIGNHMIVENGIDSHSVRLIFTENGEHVTGLGQNCQRIWNLVPDEKKPALTFNNITASGVESQYKLTKDLSLRTVVHQEVLGGLVTINGETKLIGDRRSYFDHLERLQREEL